MSRMNAVDVLPLLVERGGGRRDERGAGGEGKYAGDSGHPEPRVEAGHVATSLRREWMDIRIPKPAMRVTIEVPP